MMKSQIKNIIKDSASLKLKLTEDEQIVEQIGVCVSMIVETFAQGKKVLFCGNGGSAADAQHLAAEFSGRFYKNRKALPAEALHCNTSYLTAVGNDYGFEHVYSRLLEGLGEEGDLMVALSTSGNSPNIVQALHTAKSLGMKSIAFGGATGGQMKALAGVTLCIPSADTPRIQECHILVGHIICQLTEEQLFPDL